MTSETSSKLPNPLETRTADYPINEIFLKRWSPRAMSGETLSQDELMTLFEAARWAPSTYNEQEWRFLYANRDTDHWQTFFDLLVEANQKWCDKASTLVVVLSATKFARNGKDNPVHTFDAGAAFENLCLQAATMGLVAHGMAGFDNEKARTSLDVPDDVAVEAMIALGKPGDPENLPEGLAEKEVPSDRKPLSEIVSEGKFAF